MRSKFGTYKIYACFVAFYILVILVMPVNQLTMDKYHLSDFSYRVLLLAVSAIPAFLTWFAAFYGYEQLRRYSMTIRKSPEGAAFQRLALGAAWIAFALPIVSTLSIWLSAISHAHHDFRPGTVVITNLAMAIIAIITFSIIGTGARMLADRAKARPRLLHSRLGMLIYLVAVVYYCFFIFSHSLNIQGENPYHMAPGMMLITVMLPLAYAWFAGLLAALDVLAYASKVSGVLYKKALHYMSGGILLIIIATILLQYVNSANLNRQYLVFGWVLMIRYALYLSLATGFGLIGYGAKRLQQIEKI